MGEFRLFSVLSPFIALTLWLQSAVTSNSNTPVILSGRVLYADGTPVKDATVEIFFYYLACSGIDCHNPSGKTDADGKFTLQTLPSGEGVVTASKEREGFPNASLLLYGRTGYDSLERVDVTPGSALKDLILRFKKPNARVTFLVTDAKTMLPVQTARINISLTGEQGALISSTIPGTGAYDLLLPDHAVAIKVSAPGYSDWMFSDRDGNNSLVSQQGTHREVLVRMAGK